MFTTIELSGTVGRAPDSQLAEHGFESCLFTLHCVSSVSCVNDYLAIDSGGYLCINQFKSVHI